MVFIIRLRTSKGMHRLLFTNDQNPWANLLLQARDITGLKIAQLKITRTRPHSPDVIDPVKKTVSLASLGLVHGEMLHLKESSSPRPQSSAGERKGGLLDKSRFQLTRRCQHGPRGRCTHCDGAQPGAKSGEVKCQHGPNATCMHCSSHVNSKAQPAPWLCNHATSVFCPKCLPPEKKTNNKRLPCSCDHSKGQRCVRCHQLAATIKVDKIPYRRWLNDRKALCKTKHNPSVVCPFCAPPRVLSYKGKINCNKGHRAWPYGVCISCAPPVANITEQGYRHCDGIALPLQALQVFYREWIQQEAQQKGRPRQKAGILFGKYIDEPDKVNSGAIRAVVETIYVPPQEQKQHNVRFLRDPNEKLLHIVAAELGLEVLGWVVTTMPRKGKKYGGKVFMSSDEVTKAATFQTKYKNQEGHSRFITVVMEQANNIEPMAFQVSDQCVALQRDGVLSKSSSDPFMMATRQEKKGEIAPSVVYKNTPLLPGAEYLPDEFLVKVIVMTGGGTMFAHSTFPSSGPDSHMQANVRSHMARFGRENYNRKLSDFNLLCYLARTIGLTSIKNVCQAFRTNTSIPGNVTSAIDSALISKNLI